MLSQNRSGDSVSDPDEIVERFGHITHLPTEILTDIFSMLDTRSKGSCARVCWDWMVTVNQKCLWRDDTFLWWSQYMKNPALRETLKIRKMRKVALKISREDGKVNFDELLGEVTSSMPCPFELTELILTDNRHLSDGDVIEAAGHFTHLVRLDVGCVTHVVTDSFLDRVSCCCKKLTHLSLGDCYDLTEIGFLCLLGVWVEDEQDDTVCHPQLEDLKMADCVSLTDWNLSRLSWRQPRLRRLSLTNAFGLSDRGLHHLSDLEQLKELSVQGFSRITAKGIERFEARVKMDVMEVDEWDVTRSTSATDRLRRRFREDVFKEKSNTSRYSF